MPETAAYHAFVRGRADLFTLNLERIHSAQAGTSRRRLYFSSPTTSMLMSALATPCADFRGLHADWRSDVASVERAIRHCDARHRARSQVWRSAQRARPRAVSSRRRCCRSGRGSQSHRTRTRRLAALPAARVYQLGAGADQGQRGPHSALYPGLGLAYWQIATVLVARGAFEPGAPRPGRGMPGTGRAVPGPGSFPAVGLHLLRERYLPHNIGWPRPNRNSGAKLTFVATGQLFARQCAANTWYALGAICARQGRRDEAEAAFRQAIETAPGHMYSMAALGCPIPERPADDPRPVETAIARVIALIRAGQHVDAAAAYRIAVTLAPSAGWLLPVEPLINAAGHPEIWRDVLILVRERAV